VTSDQDGWRGEYLRENRARTRRTVLIATAAAVCVVVGVTAGVVLGNRGGSDSGASAAPAEPDRTTVAGAGMTVTRPRPTTTVRGARPSKPATTTTTATPSKRRGTAVATTAPPPTLPGGVTVTAPVAPPDAPRTVETTPKSVLIAYTDAFNAECDRIWSRAGADGKLWDPDDPTAGPFKVRDCYDLLDASLAFAWDNASDAKDAGTSDAGDAAASLTVGNQLRATNGKAFDVP
jgi:hypothetical protein